LIPLAPEFLRDRDPGDVEHRLQRIVRSNRFEVLPDACAFRILGPAVPYHAIDPCLPAGLARLQQGLRLEDAPSYRAHARAFDLCLEDSWSGYFVAEWLRSSPTAEDVVFVHLDHHTDMMSSLLVRRGDGLFDPTDARRFDPRCGADWHKGIDAGSIGIGSFLTVLFHLPGLLHVRHINDYQTSDYTTYRVMPVAREYPEIPGRSFAAVRKRRDHPAATIGTYRGGCDPTRVLEGAPPGKVVVHIDLDYFINDFNGNAFDDVAWSPAPEARAIASRKLNAFFEGLRESGRRVDHWIVATSPGFCSAYHWPWLLESIERGIARVDQ